MIFKELQIVVKEDELHRYNRLLRIRWRGMIQRCHNPLNMSYKDYGARGIIVCDEWRNSFSEYKKWIESSGLTIDNYKSLAVDRINNDGNYCSENCHLVTCLENNAFCKKRSPSKSNTIGVRFIKNMKIGKQWSSSIRFNGKTYTKYFPSVEEAIDYRKKMELEFFNIING